MIHRGTHFSRKATRISSVDVLICFNLSHSYDVMFYIIPGGYPLNPSWVSAFCSSKILIFWGVKLSSTDSLGVIRCRLGFFHPPTSLVSQLSVKKQVSIMDYRWLQYDYGLNDSQMISIMIFILKPLSWIVMVYSKPSLPGPTRWRLGRRISSGAPANIQHILHIYCSWNKYLKTSTKSIQGFVIIQKSVVNMMLFAITVCFNVFIWTCY